MSTEAERLGRIDGCPECVDNYEAPKSVVPLVGGYRAGYLCGWCGHAWYTSYREDA